MVMLEERQNGLGSLIVRMMIVVVETMKGSVHQRSQDLVVMMLLHVMVIYPLSLMTLIMFA
jgi:hypothetical protein